MALKSLAELRPGEQGVVKNISGHGLFFTRLRALGMRREQSVSVVREAPLGGSLHIRLGDRENLAVSRQEAAHIHIALL